MVAITSAASSPTIHPDNLVDYYNYLKLGDWTKVRPKLPELNEELLENLEQADRERCFKKGFVGVLSYMITLTKEKSSQQRKETIIEKNAAGQTTTTTTTATSKDSNKKNESSNNLVSLTKINSVPKALRRCTSRTVKAALAMFCTQGAASDSFRRDFLLAIIKDQFRDVADITEYMRERTDELKSRVEKCVKMEHVGGSGGGGGGRLNVNDVATDNEDGSGGGETTESRNGVPVIDKKKLSGIIKCLLEVSDIMREKSYSKLAIVVDRNICVSVLLNCTIGRPSGASVAERKIVDAVETSLISDRLDRHPFKTICPYEGLINLYVNECIPKKRQSEERSSITRNKFHVNPYATVLDMVKELPRIESFDGSSSSSSSSSGGSGDDRKKKSGSGGRIRFNPKTLYHVYVNESNFVRHLIHTFTRYNGKIYFVITYRDCLFDVIGHDDESGQNRQLYYDKTWQERLDSLPGPTRIILHEKHGNELNDYSERAVMGISWMENGLSNYVVQSFSGSSSNNGSSATNNRNNPESDNVKNSDGAAAVSNGYHNASGGALKRSRATRSPSPSAQTDVDDTFTDAAVDSGSSKTKKIKT